MTNASGGIPCAPQSFYAGMGMLCADPFAHRSGLGSFSAMILSDAHSTGSDIEYKVFGRGRGESFFKKATPAYPAICI